MIYLGDYSCDIEIYNVRMQVLSSKLAKTYTASYRAQQQIDSYRSEDKLDIFILGGLLQMEKFPYRNVHCIEVPSFCDTTQFQQKQGLSNCLGAYFLDIYSDRNGNIQYFDTEPVIFDKSDVWDEVGKDKKRVRKLEISNTIY